MLSLIFNFLWMPIIFILIGFGLGYYYFGNKEYIHAMAKEKAAEEFKKLMEGAQVRYDEKNGTAGEKTVGEETVGEKTVGEEAPMGEDEDIMA